MTLFQVLFYIDVESLQSILAVYYNILYFFLNLEYKSVLILIKYILIFNNSLYK